MLLKYFGAYKKRVRTKNEEKEETEGKRKGRYFVGISVDATKDIAIQFQVLESQSLKTLKLIVVFHDILAQFLI